MNYPERTVLWIVRWTALLAGFYWWKGGDNQKPQIVEVFFQDGKWLVARHARWMCFELDERGGMFMAMIPYPSLQGYSKAIVLNSLGAALAGIEALHAWAASHIEIYRKLWMTHKPSCECLQCLDRINVVDWIRANAILPYRRFRSQSYKVVQTDSYSIANAS